VLLSQKYVPSNSNGQCACFQFEVFALKELHFEIQAVGAQPYARGPVLAVRSSDVWKNVVPGHEVEALSPVGRLRQTIEVLSAAQVDRRLLHDCGAFA
jgi:hypothetical protein